MRLVATLLAVLSFASYAEEDGGVAEPPAPVPAPAPVVVAPPPPAAEVKPGPSVIEQVFEWVRPYGTFKPTIIVSSAAVESFSQPNASAITAAGNPVLANQPGDPRLTFQIAQSRVGLWLREKGPVRAQVEIDFIDFTKATPTVASLPRLRIAKMEWAPTEHFTLIAGQDWDLHAPINPHGSNMVGARFQSGNVGFMRQQVKALGTVGNFELAGAIGMEGVNATSKDAAFELSDVPTFAVRASYLTGKGGRVGVSGLATSLRLGYGTTSERRAFAGSAAAFADVTFGSTCVRAEFNLSQNVNNIGMLGLSYGTAAGDVAEAGGFVSVRHGFTDMHFLYGNVGTARALNPANVKPSYAYATLPADGSAPAFSAAALGTTGPGIVSNLGVTLGYELRINKNLGFLVEGFYLNTQHQLQAVDSARTNFSRQAWGSEIAALVSF